MNKTGYKTTEFWVTLAVTVAGILLTTVSGEEAGATVSGLTAAAYALSRALVKKAGAQSVTVADFAKLLEEFLKETKK